MEEKPKAKLEIGDNLAFVLIILSVCAAFVGSCWSCR